MPPQPFYELEGFPEALLVLPLGCFGAFMWKRSHR